MLNEELLMRIDEYIDGEMAVNEIPAFLEEIKGDPEAEAALRERRELAMSLRSLDCELPGGLHDDIMEKVRAERKKRFLRSWRLPAAAAAAVCLMVGGSFLVSSEISKGGGIYSSDLEACGTDPKNTILGGVLPAPQPEKIPGGMAFYLLAIKNNTGEYTTRLVEDREAAAAELSGRGFDVMDISATVVSCDENAKYGIVFEEKD